MIDGMTKALSEDWLIWIGLGWCIERWDWDWWVFIYG